MKPERSGREWVFKKTHHPHGWPLTSLQQRLVKTGGRLVKHARYYWLLLAEGHLNRRRFGAMLRGIMMLPAPVGSRSGNSGEIGPPEVNEGAMSEKSLRAKAILGLRLGATGSPALRKPLGTTGMGNHARSARRKATGCIMRPAQGLKMEIPG